MASRSPKTNILALVSALQSSVEKLDAGSANMRGRIPLQPLSLGINAFDSRLPDGGLPRGQVVEICAPRGLAKSTTIALAACAAAQREAVDDGDAWCAWIDSHSTLYAPGIKRAGVDPRRLLVIRPNFEDVARSAVRVASSAAFSLIVVDRPAARAQKHSSFLRPHASHQSYGRRDSYGRRGPRAKSQRTRWSTVVRRLALCAKNSNSTILIMSASEDSNEALPCGLRIELRRPSADQLLMQIAKERYGRTSAELSIPIAEIEGRESVGAPAQTGAQRGEALDSHNTRSTASLNRVSA